MMWLLLFVLACTKQAEVAECTYDTDCGEDAICAEDGTCVDVECLASIECDVGEFCSDDYQCEEGCAESDDCEAGEACNDGECEPYGCRSTELDCPWGTYCDVPSGDCLTDDRNHCEPCDAVVNNTGCGNNSECFILETSNGCTNDSDCPSGWRCDDIQGQVVARVCHRDWCAVSCNPNAELQCPNGMTCTNVGGGQNYCIGDCGFLTENGFL